MYRAKYHESERAYKHDIIEQVLKIVQSNGGRFLERIDDFENSYWSEVTHSVAYRKLGHAFRSNARNLTAKRRESGCGSNNQKKMNNGPPGMMMLMPPPHMAQFFAAGGVLGMPPPMGTMGANFGEYMNAGTMGMPIPFGMPPGNPMFGMMGAPANGAGAPQFFGGGVGVFNGFAPTNPGQPAGVSTEHPASGAMQPMVEGMEPVATGDAMNNPMSSEMDPSHVVEHQSMQFLQDGLPEEGEAKNELAQQQQQRQQHPEDNQQHALLEVDPQQ